MASITIDNTAKDVPIDDYQEQKVVDYNSIFAAIQAAWTAWTPTWTNLSVGNGTVTAKYRQIGKLVFCRITIVFGSTTSISGGVSFSLPVTRAANAGTAGGTPQGQATLVDASPAGTYTGVITNVTTTTAAVGALDASGTYLKIAALSSTVPITWTTSDEINAQFSYEAV